MVGYLHACDATLMVSGRGVNWDEEMEMDGHVYQVQVRGSPVCQLPPTLPMKQYQVETTGLA